MERLTVKQLYAIAKERGIKEYSGKSKAEIIEKIEQAPAPRLIFYDEPEIPILDEPIPEINVPILEPSQPRFQPSSLKNLTSGAAKPINKEINKFTDWILSYIPEPNKKTVNKRVESLKKKVNRIFTLKSLVSKRIFNKRINPKEQQTALKGYLKTYRIDGQKGHDEKMFIANIKPKVLDLINQQKKPLKVKFILTCKFIKENPATGQIDETSPPFHTKKPETITESTDLSDLFNTMTDYQLVKFDKFKRNGSGWKFDHVEYFDIHIDPFEPLSGSSYIILPSKLASKQAIINVKNERIMSVSSGQ